MHAFGIGRHRKFILLVQIIVRDKEDISKSVSILEALPEEEVDKYDGAVFF